MVNKVSPIQVFSEIGRLKRVLVKRPGVELSHITPTNMEELLFSAILDWRRAGEEHDEFCKILRENSVEVVYLEDLLIETWQAIDGMQRNELIRNFINESGVTDKILRAKLLNYLAKRSPRGMFEAMIRGITKFDLGLTKERDILVTQPMPNLYFTRDCFSSCGNGVVLSKMKHNTRARETLFSRFIFQFHPEYKNAPQYFKGIEQKWTTEGGDFFIYNKSTLVIGVSERTQKEAIVEIAKSLIKQQTPFTKIICINVPHKWNLMHLDTWLTMVDHNKFLYSPNIEKDLKFWTIDLRSKAPKMTEHNTNLEDLLESIIGVKPELIPVAGNYSQEKVDIETHFDATNFLVIKPGLVIGYDRNVRTIEALRNAGVEVLTFKGNQLSLGMGSARCMSMPLYREPVNYNLFTRSGDKHIFWQQFFGEQLAKEKKTKKANKKGK